MRRCARSSNPWGCEMSLRWKSLAWLALPVFAGCLAVGAMVGGRASAESTIWICPPCGSPCDDVQHTGPGTCKACNMTLIESTSLRHVAILVYPGVELLDFAGPGEVFAAAGAFKVVLVAETTDPVQSQGFVTVTPGHSISNCPPPDVLVIPGGRVNSVIQSPKLLEWIRGVASTARYTMSVCNGALVLSEAGLLKGKRATTHHGSIERLRHELGTAQVVDDKRWVDNGNIGT